MVKNELQIDKCGQTTRLMEAASMSEKRVSLRQIARRLAGLANVRSENRLADEHLRSLLMSGELVAGVQFPPRSDRWVVLPKAFWTTVQTQRFRSIRRRTRNGREYGGV